MPAVHGARHRFKSSWAAVGARLRGSLGPSVAGKCLASTISGPTPYRDTKAMRCHLNAPARPTRFPLPLAGPMHVLSRRRGHARSSPVRLASLALSLCSSNILLYYTTLHYTILYYTILYYTTLGRSFKSFLPVSSQGPQVYPGTPAIPGTPGGRGDPMYTRGPRPG